MSGVLARRLAALAPVMLLVLIIVFAMLRLIPGDPATVLLGPGATSAQIDALRGQLRLGEPAPMQFLAYAQGLLHGDLGRSLKSGTGVGAELLRRLPATLELSLLATIAALAAGIPLGVLSAIHPNSLFDHATRLVSLIGVSMPAFLAALVLQLIFGVWLGWLPVSGRASPYIFAEPITGFAVLDGLITGDGATAWDALLHLLMPAAVLAAFLAATVGRFVRNTMLEVMDQDFIRTARAKGVAERIVVFVHALRNALLPAVTIIGLQFAELLGGAILTETVFAWPGIGRYLFDAIRNRDYPVIQGATLMFALAFMLISLAVDLLHAALDPRLRKA